MARRAQKNTGAEELARPRMLAGALGRDTGGLAGAADAGAVTAELCETGVEEVAKNMASGYRCCRARRVAMIWEMRQRGGSTRGRGRAAVQLCGRVRTGWSGCETWKAGDGEVRAGGYIAERQRPCTGDAPHCHKRPLLEA
ncbi:hypothetical protein POSPLADRAFT_1061878 [Postia placenta MAD-698-R-SB12]|uniref:Uncharacterized protein n=1 Tax=Postia placenta MAD-698-R-SB12 TaxID=670580 RepID=A0A1X6MLN3_9APHY|nr:hypothetical protein POSPLADRAFT_1061878 [Postia placenta MAD-698-R-SB12]OSX57179.1 hypothetical protein POSPLADRAFT_1061878 [Postia placenta MAD-698-R-SB12]